MAVGDRMLVGWGYPSHNKMSALTLGRGNKPSRQIMYWGWGDDFNMDNKLVDNKWYHITYTYKNGKGILYLNGELVKTYFVAPNTSTDTKFYIANFFSTMRGFNGTIDDIRIYSRELNNNEVKALYNE